MQKNNSAIMGPGTVSSLGYAHSSLIHYLWVLLQKLRSPPRWKMVTSGWTQVWASDWLDWWLRFLEHHPIASPPSIQKKIMHLVSVLQILPIKNLFLIGKFRSFEHTPPHFPCVALEISLSPFQTLVFQFIWLHCAWGAWTWVWKHLGLQKLRFILIITIFFAYYFNLFC